MNVNLPYKLFLNTGFPSNPVLVRAKSMTDAKTCPNLVSKNLVEIVDRIPSNKWSRKTIMNSLYNFNFKDEKNIWRKCEVSEEVFYYLDKNMNGELIIYDHSGNREDFLSIQSIVENCSFLQPGVIKNVFPADMKYENGLTDIDVFLETRKPGYHLFFVFPGNISTESLFRIKYSVDTISPDISPYLHFYIYREGKKKLYQVKMDNDMVNIYNPYIYRV